MALELDFDRPSEVQAADGPGLLQMELFRRRLGAKERMFLTEQLVLLLETGTPLHGSLQAIRQQTDNPELARLLDAMLERVAEGGTFSTALAEHPQVFPVSYVKLVSAAENGGFLDKVLQQLLEMDERREKLSASIKAALSYPVFLAVFSLAVVIFVLAVVFPKFADLFQNIRDQLPATTIFLMAASDILRAYWWALSAMSVAAFLGARLWLRSPAGGAWLDGMKMRMPGIRDVFVQVYLVQSMRVMGLSLANGVSVMDTLVACRDVVENRVFRRFIHQVEERVQQGDGLAVSFQEADFVPPAVRYMITTGEETGNLPRVMSRVAQYYERELDKRLKTITRLAEPIMLIVMGTVVGIIVSSLILPIFKLSRAV